MSKHTPGPWKLIGQTDSGVSWVCPADSEELCDGFATVWSNGKANARLIASAPDLLEALQRAVACGIVPTTSVLDGGAASYSEQVRTADAIRAAIAKATGEQQ